MCAFDYQLYSDTRRIREKMSLVYPLTVGKLFFFFLSCEPKEKSRTNLRSFVCLYNTRFVPESTSSLKTRMKILRRSLLFSIYSSLLFVYSFLCICAYLRARFSLWCIYVSVILWLSLFLFFSLLLFHSHTVWLCAYVNVLELKCWANENRCVACVGCVFVSSTCIRSLLFSFHFRYWKYKYNSDTC